MKKKLARFLAIVRFARLVPESFVATRGGSRVIGGGFSAAPLLLGRHGHGTPNTEYDHVL